MKDRVLDSLDRKKKVVMNNSFSQQGEDGRQKQLDWIDNMVKKIKARK